MIVEININRNSKDKPPSLSSFPSPAVALAGHFDYFETFLVPFPPFASNPNVQGVAKNAENMQYATAKSASGYHLPMISPLMAGSRSSFSPDAEFFDYSIRKMAKKARFVDYFADVEKWFAHDKDYFACVEKGFAHDKDYFAGVEGLAAVPLPWCSTLRDSLRENEFYYFGRAKGLSNMRRTR